MLIAIIYSLPTCRALTTPFKAADEDTKESAREVEKALVTKGASVSLFPVSEDTIDTILSIKADLIFNLIEWDGLDLSLTLKALGHLESMGIPFTGVSLGALTNAADKIKMKEMLDLANLPTPPWQLFTTGQEPVSKKLHFPVILKLVWEHCSIGLTKDAIVTDPNVLRDAVTEHIRTFKQPVYVEEFISGREFQVSLIELKKGPTVLPPAEILFTTPQELTFLTYNSRWDQKHPEYKTSHVGLAKLTPSLKKKLESVSLATYKTFGCRDYARMDIRSRGKNVFILEVNPNPGLSDDKDYGMTVSYKAAGMDFSGFIWEIVVAALRRRKLSQSAS